MRAPQGRARADHAREGAEEERREATTDAQGLFKLEQVDPKHTSNQLMATVEGKEIAIWRAAGAGPEGSQRFQVLPR